MTTRPSVIRLLKACLNGGRDRSEHPGLPLTPAELAMSALAAVGTGAEAVHVHPRATDGSESLLAAHIGASVGAIRRSCPGVPIGVSTGLWITSGDVWRRTAQIAGWAELNPSQRPDFASVNLSEPGFAELTALLTAGGIGVEAGVWSIADAQALVAAGPALGWLRVLVEIIDVPVERCVAVADEVLAVLRRPPGLRIPVLLHGQGATCWPLVRRAGRLGLATRIGLEDVTTGPDGEPIRDNAQLVALALREWHLAGEPAEPS